MTEQDRIQGLLKEYGYIAKKSFGQNFLINEGIIRRIVDQMKPETFETVIEIGPGLGALTLPLSQKSKKLYAVDADRDMITILHEIFDSKKNVTLVQSDFLRFDPDSVSRKEDRLLIGNLPYNITSELFEYMLEKGFASAGAMVQKEVYEKLSYTPGKSTNTALGAFIESMGKLSLLTLVDHSSFDPSPKVESAFVRIDTDPKKSISFSLYPVYKALFRNPNKTIHNCLKEVPEYRDSLPTLSQEKPELLSSRARQLDVKTLQKLAEEIQKLS